MFVSVPLTLAFPGAVVVKTVLVKNDEVCVLIMDELELLVMLLISSGPQTS